MIWHFCSEANTKKLEKLNYRALRHVYKDYESDYDEIIAKDKSIPLQLNRMHWRCTKYLASSAHLTIKPIKETGNNLRKKNVDAPSVKTITYGKKSFKYRGSVLWNDLPNCIQTSENYNLLKKLVSNWDGKKCRCSMCRCAN